MLKLLTIISLLLTVTACESFYNLDSNGLQQLETDAADLEKQGFNQRAYDMYVQILAQQPNNTAVQVKAGDIANKMKQPSLALTHYQAALNYGESSPSLLNKTGKAYLIASQPDQAIPYFNQALQQQPSAQSYANLGVAYDMVGNAAQAQQIYRQALLQMPNDMNLRNNMGLSMLLSGNQEGAINVLQSVAQSPNATGTHLANLALAYGLAGKTAAAKRVLSKVMPSTEVERNLAVYNEMRGLNSQSLRDAVLMGDARGSDVVAQ